MVPPFVTTRQGVESADETLVAELTFAPPEASMSVSPTCVHER